MAISRFRWQVWVKTLVMVEWQSVQQAIQACRRCEIEAVAHLHVPSGEKRKPPQDPIRPVRLYFVSVAPPWGGAYFWDETKKDAVREGLFTTLRGVIDAEIENCEQFLANHLFLTPAVKCSSSKGGKDHKPSQLAVGNCASFLLEELVAAQPERILALGQKPFGSLRHLFNLRASTKVYEFRKEIWWVRVGKREVPLSGTYFPGNNRNNQHPFIKHDIERILRIFPKESSV